MEKLLPADFEQRPYVEPFVGGGAMFFHLRDRIRHGVTLSDTNERLVTMYREIRNHPEDLIFALSTMEIAYRRNPEDAYISERASFNIDSNDELLTAARMIFLNKTCFNGLYRENQRGAFNVPIGKFKTSPTICDRENIRAVSRALRYVMVYAASFEHVTVQHGAFVYCDPPYVPLNDTSSFTAYGKAGFGLEEQIKLHDWLAALDARGVKWMLSNSDTPEVRKLYEKWNITEVECARSINSRGSSRGKITELVVRNYT